MTIIKKLVKKQGIFFKHTLFFNKFLDNRHYINKFEDILRDTSAYEKILNVL